MKVTTTEAVEEEVVPLLLLPRGSPTLSSGPSTGPSPSGNYTPRRPPRSAHAVAEAAEKPPPSVGEGEALL